MFIKKETWILIAAIVITIIVLFLIYPTGCNERYYPPQQKCCPGSFPRSHPRTFPPMQLSMPGETNKDSSLFVVHPDEAPFYYSMTNYPAYLCDQSHRYYYN